MASGKTILFAGGGTGGHLYPGISVAQAMAHVPELADVKPLFLCTQRQIDEDILKPTGYEFIKQPAKPMDRSIGGLLAFWKGWRETKDVVAKVLKERNVVGALGLGGYAAGVAVKTCGQKGLPAAIINPDVVPGKANQYLLQYVQKVFCQFDATAEHVEAKHRSKLVTTGCPIREEFLNLPPRADAMKTFGLDPGLSTIVVTGASQGAKTVNEGSVEAFKALKLQGWQILHLAGKDHAGTVREDYRNAEIAATVVDFTAGMDKVWAVADLTISRAGASSCAELTACGVPSILMPYPFHKDKHQTLNAKVLVEAGGAMLCDDAMDRKKNAALLIPMLETLLYDVKKRQAMAAAVKKLGVPDAGLRCAKVLGAIVPK